MSTDLGKLAPPATRSQHIAQLKQHAKEEEAPQPGMLVVAENREES